MFQTKFWLIGVLLFVALLVACGDDSAGDTATSTPDAVETTAPAGGADADATSTGSAGEPTEESETAVTSEPTEPVTTPTEEANATATEDQSDETPMTDSTPAGQTGTSEADTTPAAQAADPEVEAELFDIVLAPEDLPSGWSGPGAAAANGAPADVGICNADPFSGTSERLAAVEAQFEQDPQQGPFLVQNLSAYPEDLAAEAMEYARSVTTNCTEWTDASGTAYTLELQNDYPQFGDESFVARITFEVPGVGPVPGEFVFVRVGGLLTFMGYIDVGEIDPVTVEDLANLAVEKMQGAGS